MEETKPNNKNLVLIAILIFLISVTIFLNWGFWSEGAETYALVIGFWALTVPSCTLLFVVSYLNKNSHSKMLQKFALAGMILAAGFVLVNGFLAGYHYLDWRLNKPAQEQIDRRNEITFGGANTINIGRAPEDTNVAKEVYESWYSKESQCSVKGLKGIAPKEHTIVLEVFWSVPKNTCLLVTRSVYSDAQDWTYEYEKETGVTLPVHIYSVIDLNASKGLDRTIEYKSYSLESPDEYHNNPDNFADLWQADFEKALEQYR
jgi:hypothetical protein